MDFWLKENLSLMILLYRNCQFQHKIENIIQLNFECACNAKTIIGGNYFTWIEIPTVKCYNLHKNLIYICEYSATGEYEYKVVKILKKR